MGKTVGMIGSVSGKVGNVVYYVRNGVQAMRVYVPKPNNPKSASQNRQRLKMALAGRLSGIVPDAALEGFGGTKSERRSRFTSNVLLNSLSTGGKASISQDLIFFSDGPLAIGMGHNLTATAPGSYQRVVTVSVTPRAQGQPLPDGYGERAVILMLNNGTSQFDYAVTGVLTMPTGETAANTQFSIIVGDIVSEYTVFLYVYPFVTHNDDGSDFRASYIGTEDGTVVVDSVTGEVLGVPTEYGRSQFLRSVTVNPPNSQQSTMRKGEK